MSVDMLHVPFFATKDVRVHDLVDVSLPFHVYRVFLGPSERAAIAGMKLWLGNRRKD